MTSSTFPISPTTSAKSKTDACLKCARNATCKTSKTSICPHFSCLYTDHLHAFTYIPKTSALKKCVQLIVFLVGSFLVGSSPCLSQIAPAPFSVLPYSELPSEITEAQKPGTLVRTETVGDPDGSWVIVRFDSFHLGEHSTLQISSRRDKSQKQFFTHNTLTAWGGESARFNGGMVDIELSISQDDQGVHYKIEELIVGEYIERSATQNPDASQAATATDTQWIPETICGTDNRRPSFDDRLGRIMPIGCTGFSLENGVYLTAGHCVGPRMMILEYRVPPSLPDGTPQSPPIEHQFKVDPASVKFEDIEPGKDWAVFSVVPNGGHRTPDKMYGSFDFAMERDAGAVAVRGYGMDDNESNLTQQHDVGELIDSFPVGTTGRNPIEHNVDTRGGNSGSPVYFVDASGKVFGVHTHGGCTKAGAKTNKGTSFSNTALWYAITDGAKDAEVHSQSLEVDFHLKGDGNHENVAIDFNRSFSRIYRVELRLQFSGDLWDPDENWYMPEFGGQNNISERSRDSAMLTSPWPSTSERFMDGKFVGNLRSENGTMRVTSIEFTIIGKAI